MRRIRAFVAVNLPIALLEKVVQRQAELRRAAREARMGVAWIPPPNLHVTLKFLGDIHEENVHAIRDLFGERLADRRPFTVVIRGAGAFPTRQRPRVLWVGVESPSGELEALGRDVDAWLGELGFEKESRPFHAHLTLGRVRHGGEDILQPIEESVFGEAVIDEVVLYESVLQRGGAEYTPHVRVPLGAPMEPAVRVPQPGQPEQVPEPRGEEDNGR